MKKLTLKPGALYAEAELPIDDWDFTTGGECGDSEKIVEVLKAHGYEIDLLTAWNAWTEHSMDFCASWLVLESEESIVKRVLNYCNIIE